jgi:hypothetical protein
MNKEFITYEQALALKELGFDEPCFKGYTEEYKTLISFTNAYTNTSVKNTLPTKPFTVPLYQQAFRWFREKQYYSEINVGCTQIDGGIGFSWRIWKPWLIEEWSPERPGEEWSYETYEGAEQACLDKLIEICKTK